ncbi:hypothetical protein Tcan_18651 [Toxocara canis]|uniref:Uncharacterized protein n=1 Tax=Toxocara canis TaxID=6265 RepID=A0A0B2VSM2_TOXCA|nr:hypothetical protein Tcan_18651 [Toxocara canis]
MKTTFLIVVLAGVSQAFLFQSLGGGCGCPPPPLPSFSCVCPPQPCPCPTKPQPNSYALPMSPFTLAPPQSLFQIGPEPPYNPPQPMYNVPPSTFYDSQHSPSSSYDTHPPPRF